MVLDFKKLWANINTGTDMHCFIGISSCMHLPSSFIPLSCIEDRKHVARYMFEVTC